jgi:hypothetical protein
MRGTLVHLVAAAALAAGIGVLVWFPGIFAPEAGGTFTVVAPAKHPLRTVVYAAGARARRHAPAPQPSTRESSGPAAGSAVAVASRRPSAPAARKRGAISGRSSRPPEPRTLADEAGPVNEKADIQSFQRRDDVGDAPPSQAAYRTPAPDEPGETP